MRSLIPARIDRLPWSPFHTRMVAALGVAWILDGLEISVASAVGDTLTQPDDAGAVVDPGGPDRHRLPGRRGRRRARVRRAVGPAGQTQPVHDHAGRLLRRQRADRADAGQRRGLAVFLYATRFISGMGIGGEYAAVNSAIDELIPAKFRGRIDIMVNGTYWFGALLGEHRHLRPAQPARPERRLADRLRDRPGPRHRDHLRPAAPAGEPALAGHARPRADEAEESISFMEHEVQEKTGRELPPVDESKAIDVKAGRGPRLPDPAARALPRVPDTVGPRRHDDDHAVVPLQRDLLHPTLVLGKFYGVASENTPLYLIAFAVGNLARPAGARALLRHHRPPEDDRDHLRDVRRAARGQRVPVQRRRAQRGHPDRRLVRHLLLRLGRGQLGVPDGERDLPDGGPGQGDRGVLRDRAVLRGDRAGRLRLADRRRQRPDRSCSTAT